MTTLEIIQRNVGSCREWLDDEIRTCNEPSEYVLWGKLIEPEGLGPRCYDHAAEHIYHMGLARKSGWAVIHLLDLAMDIENGQNTD